MTMNKFEAKRVIDEIKEGTVSKSNENSTIT